ncbi:MAG: 16S rRNA (adenine(1518)-N(6)/adenine(1519)-N(6))-dimethyltransferase RsmA [bacterium]|nr:16S rRNA (adenine(1518)-N(6)/adenine(1519)-N(6))-dimethyltransferase RsmA [bacterium]
MRAKKSLGQHFLRSEKALTTIVQAGKIDKEDAILEIGPGMGALTRKLLETGAKVIAIEKDNDLFELLRRKFEKEITSGQLNLIHDDILKFIENSKLKIENYKLIANIPYNITGAILKKFLETNYQPEQIVLLVQKEVAKRIMAQDGKESILSISIKAYGVPKYIETVKAGSFVPAPKVDSAIIAIDNISKDFFSSVQSSALDISEDNFFKILKTGFKSKRKKLSSNLSTIFTKDKVREAFQKLNLDDNLRAEDVGIETWKKLTAYLY